MTQKKAKLGIIGGSGLYDLPELQNRRENDIETPWGKPSDPLIEGTLSGLPVAFLARHGNQHTLSPSDVNYRANIAAMKMAGVTALLSVSACGSLREDLSPGTFVLIDQFVDRTTKRASSFFGPGCVAHVSLAFPVSPSLVNPIETALKTLKINYHRGGTYVAIEGPHFSTYAESSAYRAMNWDVIGMTNMPEAKLAREAEIPYATLALVTDYDCWSPTFGEVDVMEILKTLKDNVTRARNVILLLAQTFPRKVEPCQIGSDRALEFALITPPDARDPKLVAKLKTIAPRVM